MTHEQKAREIRETAETLIDDRGRDNALAWAEHCMVRDPVGGFWRAVRDAIAGAQWPPIDPTTGRPANFRRENGDWVTIAEGD